MTTIGTIGSIPWLEALDGPLLDVVGNIYVAVLCASMTLAMALPIGLFMGVFGHLRGSAAWDLRSERWMKFGLQASEVFLYCLIAAVLVTVPPVGVYIIGVHVYMRLAGGKARRSVVRQAGPPPAAR